MMNFLYNKKIVKNEQYDDIDTLNFLSQFYFYRSICEFNFEGDSKNIKELHSENRCKNIYDMTYQYILFNKTYGEKGKPYDKDSLINEFEKDYFFNNNFFFTSKKKEIYEIYDDFFVKDKLSKEHYYFDLIYSVFKFSLKGYEKNYIQNHTIDSFYSKLTNLSKFIDKNKQLNQNIKEYDTFYNLKLKFKNFLFIDKNKQLDDIELRSILKSNIENLFSIKIKSLLIEEFTDSFLNYIKTGDLKIPKWMKEEEYLNGETKPFYSKWNKYDNEIIKIIKKSPEINLCCDKIVSENFFQKENVDEKYHLNFINCRNIYNYVFDKLSNKEVENKNLYKLVKKTINVHNRDNFRKFDPEKVFDSFLTEIESVIDNNKEY